MIFKKIADNTNLQILIIIFFAALFRLTSFDSIEFKYDEALSAFQTYLFYQQPFLPQTGMIASTSMYNFPLFNYLLIIIGIFSRNPQYLTFIIALINVIAIIIFYILNTKIFGKPVAFLSALSLAISPWAILFSRKIWAQDLILIFAIPFFYLLERLIQLKKKRCLIFASLLLFLLIELHASGLFLALTTGVLLIFLKIKIDFRKVLIGFGLALIFALPYIFFEFSSNPFCRDCLAFIDYQKSSRILDFWNFHRPYQILNGSFFQFILGQDYNEFINSSPLIQPIGYLFFADFLVMLGGFIYFLKKKKEYLYLPIILIIISLLYFITRTPSYPHYYVVILPVVTTFYALSLYAFYQLRKDKLYKVGITLLFLIFFTAKVIFVSQLFQFLSLKQYISGDYGPIFKYTDDRLHQNLQQYIFLPEYDELTQYGYIFINTPVFHQKIGDYFVRKNNARYAISEYQKATENNSNDLYSKKMLDKINELLSK